MRSRISDAAAGACVSSRKWPASKMWASILVSAASMRGSRRDRRRRHAVPWAIGRLNGRHLYQEAFVGEGQDRLAPQDGPGALLVGIRARPGQQYKEISPATPAETQEAAPEPQLRTMHTCVPRRLWWTANVRSCRPSNSQDLGRLRPPHSGRRVSTAVAAGSPSRRVATRRRTAARSG